LRPADRIVRIGDRDIATWDDLELAVMPRANREVEVTVIRDRQPLTLLVTPQAVGRFELGDLGIQAVYRPQIVNVSPGGPADRAGIMRGDVILAVDSERGVDRTAIIKHIQQSVGVPVVFTIERAGQVREVSVVPKESGGVGIIGVYVNPYEVRRIDPGLFQAVRMSVKQNWDTAVFIGRTVRDLLTRQSPVRQLMGPVAIAQLSGDAAQLGWLPLLQFMAMISLQLGLVNLLPVPILDGGHIAILGLEGVARRDLSVKVKERILLVGAALIVLLMVTAIYNDVVRLLK
jgi:regulator of sigma E protease